MKKPIAKNKRARFSDDVTLQARYLYGTNCLLCNEYSDMAHTYDQAWEKRFLDLVPLCPNCNNKMQRCQKDWDIGVFGRKYLLQKASDYYHDGRYLRSFSCYRILAFLLSNRNDDINEAIRIYCLAFRPIRNILSEGTLLHNPSDKYCIKHHAEILVHLLEKILELVQKSSALPETVKFEVYKACEIVLWECEHYQTRAFKLANEALAQWGRPLERMVINFSPIAESIGQGYAYRSVFNTVLRESKSLASDDLKRGIEFAGNDRKRLANYKAMAIAKALMEENPTDFNKFVDDFEQVRGAASKISQHAATLLQAERQFQLNRCDDAMRKLQKLYIPEGIEKIST